MEKSNFDKLLERYLNNEVTEEECEKIDMWLEIRKVKGTEHLELSKKDEEKLFKKIVNNITTPADAEKFPGIKPQSFHWLLPLATMLFVIGMVGAGAYYWMSTDNTQQAINTTPIEKRILSDGTIVWLKAESTLTFIEKADIRYAELQGEALFEVAKDPAHPFIIQCGASTLKVVGTSFSVKANADSLELKVLTGKVNLTVAGSETLEVEPHEKVVYAGIGKPAKQAFDKSETNTLIADTEYNMQFVSTDLKQVFDKLQKKFDVTITLENKALESCRITIDLTDHALESSLKMIAEVLDIHYQQTNNTITINGTGCK